MNTHREKATEPPETELLSPCSWTSAPRTVRKTFLLFQPQAVTLCYSSPSQLLHRWLPAVPLQLRHGQVTQSWPMRDTGTCPGALGKTSLPIRDRERRGNPSPFSACCPRTETWSGSRHRKTLCGRSRDRPGHEWPGALVLWSQGTNPGKCSFLWSWVRERQAPSLSYVPQIYTLELKIRSVIR